MNRSKICLLLVALVCAAAAQSISLSGTVSNQAGRPIAGAIIKLMRQKLLDTTNASGVFSFGGAVSVAQAVSQPSTDNITMRSGVLSLTLKETAPVRIEILDISGHTLGRLMNSHVTPGEYRFNVVTKPFANQLLVISVTISGRVATFRYLPQGRTMHHIAPAAPSPSLGKESLVSVAAAVDTLYVAKPGYVPKTVLVTSYQGQVNVSLDTITLPKFSFFVTSLKAIQELSKSQNGFGGDFRFGKTGPGAGLRGADSICSCIAERSMPGSSAKQWRAFLSVTADEYGKPVNAIDRVGTGPWYDRLGRVLALTTADLQNTRPRNADPAIVNDLPNEDGVPNHRPDPTQPQVDNHHFVTGSTTTGTLMATGTNSTCADWTSTTASGKPRCGFSWPRSSTNGNHWLSGFDCCGCVAGIQITTTNSGGTIIGCSGGYGGFYCFALTP